MNRASVNFVMGLRLSTCIYEQLIQSYRRRRNNCHLFPSMVHDNHEINHLIVYEGSVEDGVSSYKKLVSSLNRV